MAAITAVQKVASYAAMHEWTLHHYTAVQFSILGKLGDFPCGCCNGPYICSAHLLQHKQIKSVLNSFMALDTPCNKMRCLGWYRFRFL